VTDIWGEEVGRALAVLDSGGVLEGQALADMGAFLSDSFGAGTVGIVWDRLSRDGGEAHLDVTPRLHQPSGIVHGGVWSTMVESMASVAAAIHVLSEGRVCVGAHNATDFLRPVSEGRVDGVVTPIHIGRTQQLWLVELRRATDGAPVARGQVRLANIVPGRPGP
jgi:1,4-dihydroxy-2-naphthoyl-CoA hydrolase